MTLIDQGALQGSSIPALAERLGIGERYLRKLFEQALGLSPKAYALFRQLMFAKQLLHESNLSMSAIAYASGFNSVRRFNDAFLKQVQTKPSEIRRGKHTGGQTIQLNLNYRPPLNWPAMLLYWEHRAIKGIEWIEGESYGRTFCYTNPVNGRESRGFFELKPVKDRNTLRLQIALSEADQLMPVVAHIRSLLDLDTDIETIEEHLAKEPGLAKKITSGLRIPGIWHPYEAGIRAILGQQVSIAAARTHLGRLVESLGKRDTQNPEHYYFPNPVDVASSDLDMLKMPERRRDTVREFSRWYAAAPESERSDPKHWLAIKGIGPWTVDYVRMRAFGDPDIWLDKDLGIKKALVEIYHDAPTFSPESLSPWRSYATFQLWRSLA